METTIKETVKNIFKTNTFEVALELTRDYRSEYIEEFGVKSWNGLVTYYKNANIIPAAVAAEPVDEYPAPDDEDPDDFNLEEEEEEEEEDDDLDDDYEDDEDEDLEYEDEEEESDQDDEASDIDDPQTEEERVEYMLYRNTGDNVEWFGHRENFYGLQVGATARMIRMNNRGVSDGMVVASNALTLDEVAIFHRCYAVIIRMKRSYKEQLELAARCLMNIPEATGKKNYKFPTSDIKLTDYVLNFKK